MGTPGKRLDEGTIRTIKRLREIISLRKTAKETHTSTRTVRKYTRVIEK